MTLTPENVSEGVPLRLETREPVVHVVVLGQRDTSTQDHYVVDHADGLFPVGNQVHARDSVRLGPNARLEVHP